LIVLYNPAPMIGRAVPGDHIPSPEHPSHEDLSARHLDAHSCEIAVESESS